MNKKQRNIIAAIIAIIILLIVGSIVIFNINSSKKNTVLISNLKQYTRNIPSDYKNSFQKQLYSFVTTQNQINDTSSESSYTGKIRQNTYQETSQTSDNNITFYSADFILDIESLQYSYQVHFSWNKENQHMEDSQISVSCLKPEDTIYQDFNCKDNPLVVSDKIISILPYFADTFYLSPLESSTSKSGYAVVLTYNPPESVYINGTLGSFKSSIMDNVKQFFLDNNIDISDYEIIEEYAIVE